MASVNLAVLSEVLNALAIVELVAEEASFAPSSIIGLAVDVEVGGELRTSGLGDNLSNNAVAADKNVTLVTGSAPSVRVVESAALRVRLDADSVAPEGSL